MPVLVQTDQQATLVFDRPDPSKRTVIEFLGCLATRSLNELRHFVITFHDRTFECLASGYEKRQLDESVTDAILREVRGDSA